MLRAIGELFTGKEEKRVNEMLKQVNALIAAAEKANKEAYDYYRKIAGEVEARNVSARINMTPEERRATLLSETEDVAREDQIFLREGAEMAMSQPKFSLAGTEVGFILENYDDIQDIATAVEAVVKRYPKDSVMLANVLSDYRQNANDDEFIQGLFRISKTLSICMLSIR